MPSVPKIKDMRDVLIFAIEQQLAEPIQVGTGINEDIIRTIEVRAKITPLKPAFLVDGKAMEIDIGQPTHVAEIYTLAEIDIFDVAYVDVVMPDKSLMKQIFRVGGWQFIDAERRFMRVDLQLEKNNARPY